MNTDRAKRALGLALLPLAAGCSSIPSIYEQPGDSTFGEANRQTFMAQVVNPDPVYAEPMTTSGDHAADAIERYRNDAVKEPETIRATEGMSGGGSGGGN